MYTGPGVGDRDQRQCYLSMLIAWQWECARTAGGLRARSRSRLTATSVANLSAAARARVAGGARPTQAPNVPPPPSRSRRDRLAAFAYGLAGSAYIITATAAGDRSAAWPGSPGRTSYGRSSGWGRDLGAAADNEADASAATLRLLWPAPMRLQAARHRAKPRQTPAHRASR